MNLQPTNTCNTCAGALTSLIQPDGLAQERNKQAVHNESWRVLHEDIWDAVERAFLLADCGYKSDNRSYLAGHRGFPERFAEVQEGIKSLRACCRSCNNLRKMATSVSVNVDVVGDISFVSFSPLSFTSTSFIIGTGLKK